MMAPVSPIDFDHALSDPRAVFGEPAAVLACAELDAARKRQILERWHHDAVELQTAEGEGMGGGEQSMMQRVNIALAELEQQTGLKAEHKRDITS